jgi:hypothetical protein
MDHGKEASHEFLEGGCEPTHIHDAAENPFDMIYFGIELDVLNMLGLVALLRQDEVKQLHREWLGGWLDYQSLCPRGWFFGCKSSIAGGSGSVR